MLKLTTREPTPILLTSWVHILKILVITLILLGPIYNIVVPNQRTIIFNLNHIQEGENKSSIDKIHNMAIPSWRAIPEDKFQFSKSRYLRENLFLESFKSTVHCKPQDLSRVGGKWNDGGKWTCGLKYIEKNESRDGDGINRNCVVYSFGINNDAHFEAEVLEKTSTCKIFGYDPTVDKIGYPLKSTNPRVKFQKLGLGGKNTLAEKTLKTFMNENGHKWLDILKVDIEGDELPAMERILDDFDQESLPFGQLLIEFHVLNSTEEKKMLDIFEGLEWKGLRLFYYEINPGAPYHVSEYSFVNVNSYFKNALQQLEN